MLLLLLAAAAQQPVPIDRTTGEHYVWGGVNDGWHLVKRDDMSVITERIAPGASEVRHVHARARQFFYVLAGELTMEVGGTTHVLHAGQGIEIAPGIAHQAQNRSAAPVDDDMAALWALIQSDFHANQRAVLEPLAGSGALRTGLSLDRATDILWTLNHPDVWLLLHDERGWTPEEFEQWFGNSCIELLLR